MKINTWMIAASLLLGSAMSHGAFAFSIPATAQAQAASKLAHIQLKAAQGQAEAQYLLGLMYVSGRFVAQDTLLGPQWLIRAAEQGHLKAVQTIADLSFDGKLIDKDLAQAERWYQQLAAQGDTRATFRLGFIYASGGHGVVRNCGKAVDYFLAVGDNVALGNASWILATCPESEYRNGDKAMAIAKGLVAANNQDPTHLDNLAAAYAEIGDFNAAVNIQQQAIHALKQMADQHRFDEFQLRLQHYQQQKPYRETLPL
ncbi:tetratricopeptide repeat protein [Shewanella algidipiscicola]|uniref:Sel1 repeat family protein n=1 Tax=Shewanella algidipiscicola TaxID=614070 RepID=A0ABQ4PCD2_9GAMM|nr:SEL1-like repeat protein [Shewanella algidipiscicola]GIU45195.1 hypothetical protein TUM4630_12670 [Shewanella algidipiscicola]